MDAFDEDNELKLAFLEEAKELLSGIEQCFLGLEKNPDDRGNLNQIFRFAHNLKGSSGAVGFADLAEFTHRLESLLVALNQGTRSLDGAVTDLLFRSNDYLLTTIDILRNNLNASSRNERLLEELSKALTPGAATSAPEVPEAAPAQGEESLSAEPAEIALGRPERTPSPVEAVDENIRVSLPRINELINNAGELVIYQSVLQQQSLAPGVSIPPLMRDTLAAMRKIIQNTRDLSMGLRMLPIRQTFQKMQRIVRDTSKALGKDVELHLSGEETEIDKTVLERISDPLVHLVRNAVDHGLEEGSDRLAAGKSPTGNVFLSAFHRAGHVVIEVREDGRGLDPARLIGIAASKGLIPEGAVLSPEEAYQLIFAPGFSTKSEVTDVSGRGVGMDVVKTNITRLQGQIEIETEAGKGTCFRVRLPLTLAIIDGAVIRLGEERYVVPLSQVTEFFRPKAADVNTAFGRDELLTLREEVLPTLRLEKVLRGRRNADRKAMDLTALIVRDSTQGSFAVLVDEVIAQQQIVIKPLGEEIKGRRAFMGSAILGDGRPALILDLHEVARNSNPTFKNKKHNQNQEAV